MSRAANSLAIELIEDLDRAFARGWAPDPELTVSQWAEQNRVLSAIASAEHGRFRIPRTPYLREIMDKLSVNDPTTDLCFMKGAQIGATDGVGLNWIGYVIQHAPGPMLMLQPTLTMLKKVSKHKLAPAIAAMPELEHLVGRARERDSGNTIFEKEFPGGILTMATANSAANLRMASIRYLFCDEVDGYPCDVDGEGDPIELARKRTVTFKSRRKAFYTSTPTNRGDSRIEKMYLASDQRRYFVPCPECGHEDFITWMGFADYLGQKDGGHHSIGWDPNQPETAHLVCGNPECKARIPEHRKDWMVQRGKWVATAPGPAKMPGYHLSALYSLIGQTWAECAAEFLRVKNDPPLLKVWVNTILGESWEERGWSFDVDTILARREDYPAGPEPDLEQRVPAGVGILIAAIDVQGDRLEWKIIGYGAGEESWLLVAGAESGDPSQEQVWLDVDEDLQEPLVHQNGRTVHVTAVAVDTRFHTDMAYRFCATRWGREPVQVFGVRGGNVAGEPLIGIPGRNNAYSVPIWTICTDAAKEMVYSRLAVRTVGPGYMHMPKWTDKEYVEQLTAEKALSKWINGRRTRVWEKKRDRNEQLDLEVYCLAGLHILGPRVVMALGEYAAELAKPPEGPPPAPVDQPGQVRMPARVLQRPRRGWINRF